MTYTGLLFGSFNPVHTGHLIIANHFLAHTDIEEIWFILSPQNPLKSSSEMLPDRERLKLLELAAEDNPDFHVSDVELRMPRPSYTVSTIEHLLKRHPERRFVLIIGSDNLDVFDQWKDHERLPELLPVFVYPRSPDAASSAFLRHPNITLKDAPLLEISSSNIRRLIREGKSPRYLLPDKVLERIRERGCYEKKE